MFGGGGAGYIPCRRFGHPPYPSPIARQHRGGRDGPQRHNPNGDRLYRRQPEHERHQQHHDKRHRLRARQHYACRQLLRRRRNPRCRRDDNTRGWQRFHRRGNEQSRLSLAFLPEGNALTVSPGSAVNGALFVPNGGTTLGDASSINGSLASDTVNILGNASITRYTNFKWASPLGTTKLSYWHEAIP